MPRKQKPDTMGAKYVGTLMDSIFRLSDCLLSTHPDTPRTGTVPEMMDAAVEEITRLRAENERLTGKTVPAQKPLPCPKCGSKNIAMWFAGNGSNMECGKCHEEGPRVRSHMRVNAVNAWNEWCKTVERRRCAENKEDNT